MAALGINLAWFLFQLGNFVVLLVVLTWLLHKPVLKLITDRQTEIEAGLKNAEQAKKQLQSAEEQQATILQEARIEQGHLLQEAQQQAQTLAITLKAEAAANAESMRQATEKRIAAEGEELRRELKKDLAAMVVTATEKVLKERT